MNTKPVAIGIVVLIVAVLGLLVWFLFWKVPSGGPIAHAAPAPLTVLAQTYPDGVLISWNSQQARALVFRIRHGDHDQFLDQVSGVALHDCDGQSGDVYLVQAWNAEGTTLIAEGTAEARWRMLLVGVGQ